MLEVVSFRQDGTGSGKASICRNHAGYWAMRSGWQDRNVIHGLKFKRQRRVKGGGLFMEINEAAYPPGSRKNCCNCEEPRP